MPPRTGPRTKVTKEVATLLEDARVAAGIDYAAMARMTNDWVVRKGWQIDPVDAEAVARVCRMQVKSSSFLLALQGAMGVDDTKHISVFEPFVADIARRLLRLRKSDLARFEAVEARFREVLDVVDAELAAKQKADELVGKPERSPPPPGSGMTRTKRH